MKPNNTTQQTVATTDPVGPDFTIDTMREIATRYGATSFTDRMPTDASDSGMYINPRTSEMQFGIATYTLPNDIVLTHSVASYWPERMKSLQAETTANRYYYDVIDIALPYFVPHVIVQPKLVEGATAILTPYGMRWIPKKNAQRVQLEGDFSEFIDVYAPLGEDVTPFIFLAPDIMEIALTKASSFIIEFVDNHVYVLFQQQKGVTIPPDKTTFITNQLHESILTMGLDIGTKLSNITRPTATTAPATTRMPFPSPFAILGRAFTPMLGIIAAPMLAAYLLPTALSTSDASMLITGLVVPAIILALSIFSLVFRYTKHRARLKRFHERYGNNQIL